MTDLDRIIDAALARQQLRERNRYDPIPRRRRHTCPLCKRTHKENQRCGR